MARGRGARHPRRQWRRQDDAAQLHGRLAPSRTAGRLVESAARSAIVPQLFHVDLRLLGARHRADGPGPAYRPVRRAAREGLRDRPAISRCSMQVEPSRRPAFNELSGGQRQLVMIAQALASECEIMVLDEPCSALDYKNQVDRHRDPAPAQRASMGLTIVFTTHAPQHGLEVASHVLLMNDRRSYRHGTVDGGADRRKSLGALRRADRQGGFRRMAQASPSRPSSRHDSPSRCRHAR